jgi:hypothetical protein
MTESFIALGGYMYDSYNSGPCSWRLGRTYIDLKRRKTCKRAAPWPREDPVAYHRIVGKRSHTCGEISALVQSRDLPR